MKKFLIIAVVILLVGLAVYFFFYNKDSGQLTNEDGSSDEFSSDQELGPIEPDALFLEPVTFSVLKESYSHADFSFKYSDGFKITSVPVEGGEMITVENEKGSGFQIYIVPFDESGMITPERIWQDLPDAVVDDPKNADLDGVKTLVFNGYDENFGDTFEAWANNKGLLYQISGPKTATNLIIETLETWDWK